MFAFHYAPKAGDKPSRFDFFYSRLMTYFTIEARAYARIMVGTYE